MLNTRFLSIHGWRRGGCHGNSIWSIHWSFRGEQTDNKIQRSPNVVLPSLTLMSVCEADGQGGEALELTETSHLGFVYNCLILSSLSWVLTVLLPKDSIRHLAAGQTEQQSQARTLPYSQETSGRNSATSGSQSSGSVMEKDVPPDFPSSHRVP